MRRRLETKFSATLKRKKITHVYANSSKITNVYANSSARRNSEREGSFFL